MVFFLGKNFIFLTVIRMYKRGDFYCVSPEWLKDLAEELQTDLANNTTLTLPEKLGKGHLFFIQVIPGISVMLFDFVLAKSFSIKNTNDNIDRISFYYDISDSENQLINKNNIQKVGNISKLGLSIFDSNNDTVFKPSLEHRTFAINLTIDKRLLTQLIKNNPEQDLIHQNIDFSKRNLFYTSEIDSDSLLMLTSLKNMPISTTSYDTNLRGISLKLLANTFIKLAEENLEEKKISKADIQGLQKSKDFMFKDIIGTFPSIGSLSKVAGMSTTKFKLLFKKYFHNTPKELFIKEKMIQANILLQSGDYISLSEIIKDLNYYNSKQFSTKYFSIFNRKPIDDFIKKDISNRA